MLIGTPKEIKNHEYRVGLTPAAVRELVAHGHEVMVERDAGTGIGLTDDDYRGGRRRDRRQPPTEIFARAEMIVKVKEPQPASARCCAPARCCSPTCTSRPIRSRPQALVEVRRHRHRLRDGHRRQRRPAAAGADEPRSPAAWRSRPARTAWKRAHGGRGVLLGGVPGVPSRPRSW